MVSAHLRASWLVAALVGAGCGAHDVSEGSVETTVPFVVVEQTSTPEHQGSGGLGQERSREIVDATILQLSSAESFGFVYPYTEIARALKDADERGELVVDLDLFLTSAVGCVLDYGLEAEVTEDGAIAYDTPTSEERLASNIALAECELKLAQEGLTHSVPALSEDDLQALYSSLLEVHECLKERGYRTSDPPDFEIWVNIEAISRWDPLDELISRSGGENDEFIVDEAMAECDYDLVG